MIIKPALQEMLKGILLAEGKIYISARTQVRSSLTKKINK
jgi:hypothetical protein